MIDGISVLDIIVDSFSLLLCISLTILLVRSIRKLDQQGELLGIAINLLQTAVPLIREETKRKVAHTEAFERLADPETIVEDMERAADILEARQANRLTMPREDAGRPARVFRPKFSGKRASFWNPPRP